MGRWPTIFEDPP